MRTTFRLDDNLLRELKSRAAASGKSMNRLVEEALQLSFAIQDRPRESVALITDGGSGTLATGVDLTNNEAVRDLMDF